MLTNTIRVVAVLMGVMMMLVVVVMMMTVLVLEVVLVKLRKIPLTWNGIQKKYHSHGFSHCMM